MTEKCRHFLQGYAFFIALQAKWGDLGDNNPMIHFLTILLRVISFIALAALAVILLFPVLTEIYPRDRWGVRVRLFLVRDCFYQASRQLMRAIVISYVRWSSRKATRHLAWARRWFGRREITVFPRSHAVRTAMSQWYAYKPLAMVGYLVKACIFLLFAVNAGIFGAESIAALSRLWADSGKAPSFWERGRLGDGARDSIVFLVSNCRFVLGVIADKASPYLSALADPWGRPLDAVIAAVVLVSSIPMLMALRVAWAKFWRVSRKSMFYGAYGFQSPSPRFDFFRMLLSLRVGESGRNRSVVALVNSLAGVGVAYSSHRLAMMNRNPLAAPRVHLADAERVVWSAWRTRHAVTRGVLRDRHKEHAAHVVGALRAIEARQDTDADLGRVLTDMAQMLAKIADRYAAGRTLALLDPVDLTDVTPAVNREWVRMAILGISVVTSAVTASALGMSDAVIAQIVGVVSLVMVGLLYGARLAPTDLMDVVRGQSRK